MVKKNLKYLLSLLLVIAIIICSSVCFADEETEETTENITLTASNEESSENESDTNEGASTEDPEIYNGDLYIMDLDVTMDKYVDGNVFILGKDVKITGQINGNLFILADTVTFGHQSEIEEENILPYVQNSIFVCANSIYYNCGCYGNLYALSANKLELTYDSFIARDLKAACSKLILKCAVGRTTDVIATESIDLGPSDSDTVEKLGYEDIPAFYGDFNYTAKSEVQIPEGALAGEESKSNFTPIVESDNTGSSLSDIILGFITSAVTALVIAFVVKSFLPSVDEKINKFSYSPLSVLKSFGIGLLISLCLIIVSLLLLISAIGAKLSIIFILFIIFIYFICGPLFIISISDILKSKLNIEKGYIYYLLIALVSLILHAISFIPVLGGLIVFIILHTVIGLYVQALPKKCCNKEKVEDNQ